MRRDSGFSSPVVIVTCADTPKEIIHGACTTTSMLILDDGTFVIDVDNAFAFGVVAIGVARLLISLFLPTFTS